MNTAVWNQLPEVRTPAGRTAADLSGEGPRRQALPGLKPVYRDIVDYIVRCTHRIWGQKDIRLCRTHYADSCVMHTLNDPSCGMEKLVQGTLSALSAFADRQVVVEDVIWSEDAPGLFYSSHRITSRSTHEGVDTRFGAGAGKAQTATTVADCVVRDNLIAEEWLFRDNARAALQMGQSPRAVAAAQADADRLGDPARHAWRQAWIDRVRGHEPRWPDADHPASGPARLLDAAWRADLYGEAARRVSPSIEVCWPTGRYGWGRGYWAGCLVQLRAQLHRFAMAIDHWAARPLPHGDVVALRWSACGVHAGAIPWGAPTGRDILMAGSSHYVLRHGRILRDQTIFDELAVLRQVQGGLGAQAPTGDAACGMNGAANGAANGAGCDALAVLRRLLCGQVAAADHVANALRVEAHCSTTFGRTDGIDLFTVHPLVFSSGAQCLVSPQALAFLDDTADGRTVGAFADLVDGVIARLWVVTATALDAVVEPAVAVARDDFMSQLRQRCRSDATDHLGLQADAWSVVLELGSAALNAPPALAAASSSQVWVMRAFSSGASVAALHHLRVQAATLPRQAHHRLAVAIARVNDQNHSAPLHSRLALSDPLPEPAPVSL